MDEATLLYTYKVWGGVSVKDYKQKKAYKLLGLLLFLLACGLWGVPTVNGWILALIVILGSSSLTVFEQLHSATLQLSTSELTISRKKRKRLIQLEEVVLFKFYTSSQDEDAHSNLLVALLPGDEIDISLKNMPEREVRKFLTALHNLGFTINCPYEDLRIQDTIYYITTPG